MRRFWHARDDLALAAAAVLIVLTGITGSGYWIYTLSLVAVYAIAGVGFNIALGLAGQVSFAQVAFMAVGGYSTALLTVRAHLSPWLGLAAGLVLGAVLSYLVNLPFLRLRGHYLGMATLALALGTESFAANATGFTGGALGVPGVPPLAIGGFVIDTRLRFFVLAWAACGLTVLIYHLTARSHLGRAWRAIAARPDVSASLGVNVPRARLLALGMAGTMAALSGSLLAEYLNYVAPDYFGITMIGNIFFMVIVGGLGSTAGPVLGAAVVVILPQQMSSLGQWQGVVLLVILLAFLVLWPAGLLGDPGIAGSVRNLLPLRLQSGLRRTASLGTGER
jgi:branched-chain amino acid transport system permease protein